MLFNSSEFVLFYIIVTALYFILAHKYRWGLLLAASCYFYMFFKPEYILILFFTIVIDYFAGISIENAKSAKQRKNYLILSLIANIGVLAVFKYYNFINDNITGLAGAFGIENHIPYLSILLPIGLSFHTFQAMSYTIEVYRGNFKAEKHFGIYSLYVMFYPQLVAGPIERPQNVLHQFHEKHTFSKQNFVDGFMLIAYGMFKKVVISDRLSVYVNSVYGNIDNASSLSILIAMVFFSIQIYCDFSGYSDIALGTAKTMGYDLMVNFRRPYTAKSISDFWSRWHISLSTWFRDYLYIPLGGNRVSKAKWLFNIAVVFMVSGIWHGANWTFIIWGALHALFNVGQIVAKPSLDGFTKATGIVKFPSFIKNTFNIGLTFSVVTLAWVFFRAESLNHAAEIFQRLFAFDFATTTSQLFADKGPLNFLLSLAVIGLLFVSYLLPSDLSKVKYKNLFLITTFVIIFLIGKNSNAEFIYFQF